jgi:hypothetical protein
MLPSDTDSLNPEPALSNAEFGDGERSPLQKLTLWDRWVARVIGRDEFSHREAFGVVSFFGGSAFAVGLFLALFRFAWFSEPDPKSIIVYLGFLIPMLMLGYLTQILWFESSRLIRKLGWACAFVAVAFTIGVFVLAMTWMLVSSLVPDEVSAICLLCGFFVPMFASGSAAISFVSRWEG